MSDFFAAIRSGDRHAVGELLDRSPDLVSKHDPGAFGATGLIHAVQCDDTPMVDLLLGRGADLDQRSDWWAGSFGVLDHASDEMASYLLGRGASLTPHAASRLGMLSELTAMIDADPGCVHARGGDGQYPLHLSRTTEVADLLLAAGAPIDARDVDHESTAAQWLAVSRSEVARHLLARGCAADPFLAAATGERDLLDGLVARDPDGVDARISRDRFSTAGERAAEHIYFYTIGEGCSLLHAAAATDRGDVVRWLIAAGADTEARGGYDRATPLHAAAWADAPQAVRALVEGGAAIDALSGDIHRNEPVGWAIVSGAAAAFEILLEHGARIRGPHRQGAEAGARGNFRPFRRDRPLEEWVRIRDRLRGSEATPP